MRADSSGRTQFISRMISRGTPSGGVAPAASGSSRASNSRAVCGIEAGADLAAIVQLAVLEFGHAERGQPFGRVGGGVAGNDEIVLLQRLDLGPALGAAALVGGGGALGDDAFQSELRHLVVEPLPVAFDMVGELDGGVGAEAGEQLREQRLAPDERRLPQIPAVQMKQVEGIEMQLVAGALGQRILQQGEAADALGVEHDNLAVDDRIATRQFARKACGRSP